MNILLVTHSFAPLNVISSLRVTQWTKYWLLQGHKVTVLTSKKYGFEGALDLEEVTDDNLKIIEVDYLPGWLLTRLSKQKSETITAKGNDSKTKLLKSRFIGSLITLTRYCLGSFANFTCLWVSKASKIGTELVEKESFDVLISSFGPVGVSLVASKVAKKGALKWAADYRDLWSLNHLPNRSSFIKMIEFKLEKKLLANALCCFSVSEDLCEDLNKNFNLPCLEVMNGFDPEEYENIEDLPVPAEFDNEKINIVYAGMIYPGRRDPTPLFDAIEKYHLQSKVSIHFYGTKMGGVNQDVIGRGLEKCVFFHGHRSRKDILNTMSKANVLLFLESGSPDASGVLTGKLFEYIAVKKPILALGIKKNFQSAKMIKAFGIGLVTEDELNAINSFLKEPQKFYKPDSKLINSVRRDIQAEDVIKFIKNV
jgi:hypothetical protein